MKRKAVKNGIFLLVFTLILQTIQCIMTPKWRFDPVKYSEGETDRYASFYSLPRDTVDYFTIGASTSFYSVSPMQVYARSGITGYDLGSSGQGIELSYYMLKEGLKTQSPKVLFIDADMLLKGPKTSSSLLTKALIQMRMSSNKIEAALVCSQKQGSLELLLPIIQFHDRWESLTKEDFEVGASPDYHMAGAFSAIGVSMYSNKTDRPLGDIYTLNESGYTVKSEQVSIHEDSAKYFEKILGLCKEKGIEVVPMKGATMGNPEKDTIIEAYLDTLGLTLLDLNDESVHLNWKQDTHDDGRHVNYWGSAKATLYLSEYLQEKKLDDHRGQERYSVWDEMLQDYQQWEEETLRNKTINDAYEYLNCLPMIKDDCLIVIAVKDDASYAWNDHMESVIQRLGVKSSIFNQAQNSFIAVIDQGANVFEKLDNKKISVNSHFTSNDGKKHTLSISSSGWVYGNNSTIKVDGIEYSLNQRGLNIVVVEKNAGQVISSVSIDSHVREMTLQQRSLPDVQSAIWKDYTRTVQIVENGVYNIAASGDADCLVDVANGSQDDNANVALWKRNGEAPQEFEITYIGSGLYTIRAVCSDKYLAIESMGSTSESNVVQQKYTGLANQKWFITENKNNSYSFTSLYNGCDLDVRGGKASPGVNIQVYTENYQPAQLFYLEKVE